MMAPADLATIYNFNPLFKASSPITGQGQTIALAEDTNLYSNSDWSNFRSIFGLTAYSSGNLQIVHPAPKSGGTNCSNPGVNSDDVEATLDVEWASAAAPNATIMLTSCDSVGSTDGVYLSIQNLVNGKTAPPPIVSVSYGICETENGAAGNKAFYTLYQTAVAQGVSVFVATGDNGPLDCSDGSENNMGIGVNGWASTPYNVAVGGTDFSDTYSGTNGTYWGKSTGKPWGTAKSYIPETPWNDTCASTLLATSYGYSVSYGKSGFCNSSDGSDYLQLGGGEGGPSACATGSSSSSSGVVNGTCKGYPKPNWQAGVYGIPADGVRDLPDVSLFAADGTWNHQYLICYTDRHNGGTVNCSGDPNNWGAGGGGTSYATPIIAGIQALVNEKMGGKAQGNPNPVYYKLAAKEYGASGNASCNSNKGKSILSTCIFNDVTLGDDMQNCRGTHNCFLDGGTNGVLSVLSSSYKPAFMAKIGFDFPSGIGTINAKNLVNSWAGATK
jgi:subtilase family serine protease